ncbi:MAG TPA: hypothetical protein VJ775_05975 [Sphingomicrobium sp.]|nr:hypothetical protein [Sphingomicrobium sp.]
MSAPAARLRKEYTPHVDQEGPWSMRAVAVNGGDFGEHVGFFGWLTGIATAGLGAFGLWLANRMLGKAAFQTAINDGFAKLTKELQHERDALREELKVERLRGEGERASLKGEIRNLMQTIESLKSELRRHGVPIPEGSAIGRSPEAGAVIIETREKP